MGVVTIIASVAALLMLVKEDAYLIVLPAWQNAVIIVKCPVRVMSLNHFKEEIYK